MKKSFSNINAFTIVELIVAATILVLLTTIWFYNYIQSLSLARDSTRKSDIITLESQLWNHKRIYGSFPTPWASFEIHNQSYKVAEQWFINKDIWIENATTLPTDPFLKIPYTYSVSRNNQEFQLAATLENDEINKAIIRWNYVTVSRNILPTIILAHQGTWALEINPSVWNGSQNRNSFVFNESIINLVYDFTSWEPVIRWNFSSLLNEALSNNFWQSSSYRSCAEIWTAWKAISPNGWSDEYQIRNSTGQLENILCSCDINWCTEAS